MRRAGTSTARFGAAALVLVLCGCGDLVLAPPFATVALSVEPLALEFGEVQTGTKATLSIEIKNATRRPMKFTVVTPPPPPFGWDVEGEEFKVAGRGALAGPDAPGEQIEVWFSPGLGEVGRHGGKLELLGPDGTLYAIPFSARAIEERVTCTPLSLDFGNVVVGEVRRIEGPGGLACTNRSSQPVALLVRMPVQLYPDDVGSLFSVDRAALPPVIAAHDTVSIPLRFTALGRGDFARAFLPIVDADNGDPLVPGQGIELTGKVLPEQVVQFGDNAAEQVLDFGMVALGDAAERSLRLQNRYDRSVTVTVEPPARAPDFQVVGFPSRLGPDLAPDDSGLLWVRFAPEGPDVQTATLRVGVERDDAPGRIVYQEIQLRGFGGGPKVVCDSALAFGEWAVGTPVTETVACRNEGTDLPTGVDDLELIGIAVCANAFHPRLVPGAGGDFGVEVVYKPLAEGPDLDELLIVHCTGAGCSAPPGELPRRIECPGPGEEFVLRRGENLTRVQLSGTGVHLPPCDAAFEPPNLDFGHVARAAEVARLGVRLVNRGRTECLLFPPRPAAAPSGFVAPPASAWPRRLAAGDEVFVPVEFRPADAPAGPVAVAWTVGITNPARPELSLPLAAEAGGSCLELEPPFVDFTAPDLAPPPADPAAPDRAVDPGLACGAPDVPVRVRNGCPDLWGVTAIGPAVGSDAGFLAPAPGTLPSYLAPSMAHVFPVDFRPDGEGAFSGGIRVEATGPGGIRESLFLPVRGVAADGGRWVDRYALVKPRLDLLLVVSSSMDMASPPVRSALDRQAAPDGALRRSLDRPDLDWQVGITTTDFETPNSVACLYGTRNGGEKGRLVPATGGRARLLWPGMPDFAAAFADNVADVTPCPIFERGFDAAVAAVTPPLVTSDEVAGSLGNRGLSREGAHLAVVFVSAGDDEGSRPASEVIGALASQKAPGLFSTWAIVGEPWEGCRFPTGEYAGPGNRYRALVSAAGFSSRSVCQPDEWADIWDAAGQRASLSQSSYVLDAPAERAEAIELFHVTPNGLRTPVRAEWWSYDASRHAIVLRSLGLQGLLEVGGGLEVRYRLGCPDAD